VCALREADLLQAAHILEDRDPRGVAAVVNGIALCAMHHLAYDRNLMGIDPRGGVHISERLLREQDGPMLRSGLQGFHGTAILQPAGPPSAQTQIASSCDSSAFSLPPHDWHQWAKAGVLGDAAPACGTCSRTRQAESSLETDRDPILGERLRRRRLASRSPTSGSSWSYSSRDSGSRRRAVHSLPVRWNIALPLESSSRRPLFFIRPCGREPMRATTLSGTWRANSAAIRSLNGLFRSTLNVRSSSMNSHVFPSMSMNHWRTSRA